LAELVSSGNIRRACKAARISREAVRKRRRRDPYLDTACKAAIEASKARAHEYLASAMAETFDPDALPDPDTSPLPRVSIAEAIKIAQLKAPAGCDAAAAGFVLENGPRDIEAVRARLEQRMRALGLLADEDDDEERRANGWSYDHEYETAVPPGWVRADAILP